MKICLICPEKDYRNNRFENWAEYLLEIDYVTAYIKKNINCTIEVINFNEFSARDEQINEKLLSFDLISIYFLEDNIGASYKLCMHLKRKKANIFLVGIGKYASSEYERLLNRKLVDLCILGEIEQTLEEIIKKVCESRDIYSIDGIAFDKNGSIIRTKQRKLLENIDFNSGHKYSIYGNSAALQTTRGCCNRCTFCYRHTYYNHNIGAKLRFRKPLSVIAEIKELYSVHGIKRIVLCDCSFFNNVKWNSEFLQLLKDAALPVEFICSMRSDDVLKSMDQLLTFKQVGLIQIELGIESFLDVQLSRFMKNVTASENMRALEFLNQHDIYCVFKLLLYEPFVTINDIWQTIQVIKCLSWYSNRNNALEPLSLALKVFPYTGTLFKNDLIAHGLLEGYNRYRFANDNVSAFYHTTQQWRKSVKRIYQLKNDDALFIGREKKRLLYDLFWLDLRFLEYKISLIQEGIDLDNTTETTIFENELEILHQKFTVSLQK